MAYISSFTYCEAIQVEMTQQGPQQQIINPLQILAPASIPGNYSFSIVCSIADFNVLEEHVTNLTFLSPSGDILYSTGDVHFQIPEDSNNGQPLTGVQFNVDIRNLLFKEPGIFSTKVIFDEQLLGEYKIKVTVGEY